MPRNASGTYTLPSGNPVVTGTVIQSSWANNTLSDVGNELTNSLSRSGAGGMTGAFRAADGSSSVPAISWGNETNTGFYRAGSADTRLIIASTEVQKWLATGSTISGTFSVSGTTTLASLTASKAVFTDASKNLTSSGTLGVDQGGTGAVTLTGVLKGNGTSAFTAAVAGTDFLAPPSGTAILKANSGGALANAVAGTDYVSPTGTETLTNKIISGGVFNDGYTEETVTANTGTSYTISLANGTVQILTLTGNCTYTFPTATAGQSFLLVQKQDGTGSRTATWPAAVKWPASTAPTLTSTASKADVFAFTADGTNWYGRVIGQNYL